MARKENYFLSDGVMSLILKICWGIRFGLFGIEKLGSLAIVVEVWGKERGIVSKYGEYC